MHLAVEAESVHVAQLLLEHGHDHLIHQANDMGDSRTSHHFLGVCTSHQLANHPSFRTALTQAAQKGTHHVGKFLLDSAANIEHSGLLNRTALLAAVTHNRTKFVKMLLEAGANTEATDYQNHTGQYFYVCLPSVRVDWDSHTSWSCAHVTFSSHGCHLP